MTLFLVPCLMKDPALTSALLRQQSNAVRHISVSYWIGFEEQAIVNKLAIASFFSDYLKPSAHVALLRQIIDSMRGMTPRFGLAVDSGGERLSIDYMVWDPRRESGQSKKETQPLRWLIQMAQAVRGSGENGNGDGRSTGPMEPFGWHGFQVRFTEPFGEDFEANIDQLRYLQRMLRRVGEGLSNPKNLIEDTTLKRSRWGKGLCRIRWSDKRLYFTVSLDTKTVTLLAFRYKHETMTTLGRREIADQAFIERLHRHRDRFVTDREQETHLFKVLFPEVGQISAELEDPLLKDLLDPQSVFQDIKLEILSPLRKSHFIGGTAKILYHLQENPEQRVLLTVCMELIMAAEEVQMSPERMIDFFFGDSLRDAQRIELKRQLGLWLKDWLTVSAVIKRHLQDAFSGLSDPDFPVIRYVYYQMGSGLIRRFVVQRLELWARWRSQYGVSTSQGRRAALSAIRRGYELLRVPLDPDSIEQPQSDGVETLISLLGTPVQASLQPFETLQMAIQEVVSISQERSSAAHVSSLSQDAEGPGSPGLPAGLPEDWQVRCRSVLIQKGLKPEVLTDETLSMIARIALSDDSNSTKKKDLKEVLNRHKMYLDDKVVGQCLAQLAEMLRVPVAAAVAAASVVEATLAELKRVLDEEWRNIFFPLGDAPEVQRKVFAQSGTKWITVDQGRQRVVDLLNFNDQSRVLEVGPGGRGFQLAAALSGAKVVVVQRTEETSEEYEQRLQNEEQFDIDWEEINAGDTHNVHFNRERTLRKLGRQAGKLRFQASLDLQKPPYERFRSLSGGNIEIIADDAVKSEVQNKVLEWTHTNGKFTHLIANDIVGVGVVLEDPSTISEESDMAALFHFLAEMADPGGAEIYMSACDDHIDPKFTELAVPDPDFVEILGIHHFKVTHVDKVTTPSSFGLKRGFILHVVGDPKAPAWVRPENLVLPSFEHYRNQEEKREEGDSVQRILKRYIDLGENYETHAETAEFLNAFAQKCLGQKDWMSPDFTALEKWLHNYMHESIHVDLRNTAVLDNGWVVIPVRREDQYRYFFAHPGQSPKTPGDWTEGWYNQRDMEERLWTYVQNKEYHALWVNWENTATWREDPPKAEVLKQLLSLHKKGIPMAIVTQRDEAFRGQIIKYFAEMTGATDEDLAGIIVYFSNGTTAMDLRSGEQFYGQALAPNTSRQLHELLDEQQRNFPNIISRIEYTHQSAIIHLKPSTSKNERDFTDAFSNALSKTAFDQSMTFKRNLRSATPTVVLQLRAIRQIKGLHDFAERFHLDIYRIAKVGNHGTSGQQEAHSIEDPQLYEGKDWEVIRLDGGFTVGGREKGRDTSAVFPLASTKIHDAGLLELLSKLRFTRFEPSEPSDLSPKGSSSPPAASTFEAPSLSPKAEPTGELLRHSLSQSS